MLGNKAVFGTVNAARRHDDQAADALTKADPDWLAQLITRRLAPEAWPEALTKYLPLLNLLTAPWRARFAFTSVIALLVLVALSVWRQRLRLGYEGWQASQGSSPC